MTNTINIVDQLELSTMSLISEIEELRKENKQLRLENTNLKTEKEKILTDKNNQEHKIKELIALVDAVSNLELAQAANSNITTVKPVLVQG